MLCQRFEYPPQYPAFDPAEKAPEKYRFDLRLADINLAKAKNCMACHSVDKKVVGPAFKETSKEARRTPWTSSFKKVLEGSTGVWGGMPMPPNTSANETEARTLVQWILKQK